MMWCLSRTFPVTSLLNIKQIILAEMEKYTNHSVVNYLKKFCLTIIFFIENVFGRRFILNSCIWTKFFRYFSMSFNGFLVFLEISSESFFVCGSVLEIISDVSLDRDAFSLTVEILLQSIAISIGQIGDKEVIVWEFSFKCAVGIVLKCYQGF